MTPKELLERNKVWRSSLKDNASKKLQELSKEQNPEILLIGCSDSRVSPSVLFGVGLGELFVHRNIANQAKLDDPNFLAILEFSINTLKVKYIIVLGHYRCGGVKAALQDPTDNKVSEWVQPIRIMAKEVYSNSENDENCNWDKLVEINTLKQIEIVQQTNIYQKAKALGKAPELFAWVVNISTGKINSLS